MKKFILAFLLLTLGYLAFEYLTLPDVATLRTEHPTTTAFMELRKEQLEDAGKDVKITYEWVPYSAISPYLRRAVLVSEDNGFYEHQGVEVEQLKEALKKDIERRELAFGGSTITQQLAKNLYLSPSKNPIRKVKELIIARRLERELSKKRILELYLNVVEFGETAYGAEAGSRFHFGKSARALSVQEAALLAGCLPNPRLMNPSRPNKRLKARQRTILSRMKRWGHLAEKTVLTEKRKADAPKENEETTTAPPVEAAAPAEDPSIIEDSTSTGGSEPDTSQQPPTETAEPVQEAPDDPPTETAPPP